MPRIFMYWYHYWEWNYKLLPMLKPARPQMRVSAWWILAIKLSCTSFWNLAIFLSFAILGILSGFFLCYFSFTVIVCWFVFDGAFLDGSLSTFGYRWNICPFTNTQNLPTLWLGFAPQQDFQTLFNQKRRRRRRKKHWNARIDTQTANVQFTQWPDRNRSTSTPLLKCEYEFQHIFQRRAHSLYMEFTWVPRYVREFQPWFGPKRDAQNSTREKYRAARCT